MHTFIFSLSSTKQYQRESTRRKGIVRPNNFIRSESFSNGNDHCGLSYYDFSTRFTGAKISLKAVTINYIYNVNVKKLVRQKCLSPSKQFISALNEKEGDLMKPNTEMALAILQIINYREKSLCFSFSIAKRISDPFAFTMRLRIWLLCNTNQAAPRQSEKRF